MANKLLSKEELRRSIEETPRNFRKDQSRDRAVVRISREMIRREFASLLANMLGLSLFRVEPCCSVQIKYNKENNCDELRVEYGDYIVESDIETDAVNWSIDDYLKTILRPMVENMVKAIERDKAMTTEQKKPVKDPILQTYLRS